MVRIMRKICPKIFYSPYYDIRLYGLERVHPFDSCKYSRIWQKLHDYFKGKLLDWTIEPNRPVDDSDLLAIHTETYLKHLKSPQYLAQALEIPALALMTIPLSLPFVAKLSKVLWERHILNSILEPMRWATMGTVMAAKEAFESGITINLSGGYHHASSDHGEGFCIYSDIALAISKLRQFGTILKNKDKVLIIDLDAHQGNGLERIFYEDECVYIFDMYNKDIYPGDKWARKRRNNYNVELSSGSDDKDYLHKLKSNIDSFINNIERPKIVFYNAGTDIYKGDPLGKLNVSQDGILERDMFIFETICRERLPCVMTLAGGYTKESSILVERSIRTLFENFGSQLSH